MLTKFRKDYLSSLAEFIAEDYNGGQLIVPRSIAERKMITYSYGRYQNAFDGLIEHDAGDFHIYINLDKAKEETSPRARFTFAHELGHFFIDEHRNALRNGRTPSHPSHNFRSKNLVEVEADYFAASLLMPATRVRDHVRGKKFGLAIVESIRSTFQVSTTAALLRFVEIGNHPIMVICSRAGEVDWAASSNDFPFKTIKGAKISRQIPKHTATREYWDSKREYQTVMEVTAGDWFENVYEDDIDRMFYERCIYSERFGYGFILTVLWED
jgi:Zn-dependent peptidase ImmA (M78 family)